MHSWKFQPHRKAILQKVKKLILCLFNAKIRYEQKRLVKEAEKFKEEDNKVKERIEAKNSLEQYCYQVKQSINDAKLKDKFSEDERKQIEGKIDEVLKWVNDNPAASKEEYDAKVKEIEAVFNPIMQKIYQQMGGQPGGMPNFGGAHPGAGAARPGSESA